MTKATSSGNDNFASAALLVALAAGLNPAAQQFVSASHEEWDRKASRAEALFIAWLDLAAKRNQAELQISEYVGWCGNDPLKNEIKVKIDDAECNADGTAKVDLSSTDPFMSEVLNFWIKVDGYVRADEVDVEELSLYLGSDAEHWTRLLSTFQSARERANAPHSRHLEQAISGTRSIHYGQRKITVGGGLGQVSETELTVHIPMLNSLVRKGGVELKSLEQSLLHWGSDRTINCPTELGSAFASIGLERGMRVLCAGLVSGEIVKGHDPWQLDPPPEARPTWQLRQLEFFEENQPCYALLAEGDAREASMHVRL